ncbi:methyl-accepting chemotaxis protein [Leptospira ellisii]|uniref:Methyl-accepting chemotaxis protein n=1 Tax=Leptospira ellisii TaxID=2023197 RepID=A0A2N0BI39_9LEPT|nr:methyl-accepting chemotaxis protein [Leptospira ellisii]MDV6235233.1 methyl-accepting chemotaxis protein [Leptospira ellisii]PJZ92374.1 methyl-accepting chemotaxis protein [Leptospira ellisii]PKA03620.1 methyl-accepting chemotaxis protein [Leptospira ellisii]
MDEITQSIRKFTVQFIVLTEVVSYVVAIVTSVVFYFTFLELDSEQARIAVYLTLGTSVFTLLYTFFSDRRRLSPIQKYRATVETGVIDRETAIRAQKSVLRLPLFQALDVSGRICVTGFIVIVSLGNFAALDKADYYNLFAILFLLSFSLGVYTFLITERLTSRLIQSGAFSNIDSSSFVKIRLTRSLTFTFFFIVIVLAIGVSSLVFKLNYTAIRNSYFNQMVNVNETLHILTETIFEEVQGDADRLRSDESFLALLASSKNAEISRILANLLGRSPKYESISVLQTDGFTWKVVVGTGTLAPDGATRLSEFQLPSLNKVDEAISKNRIFLSEPIASPISGTPTVLALEAIPGNPSLFLAYGLRIADLTSKLIGAIQIGKSGYPGLLNHTEIVINHVNPALNLKKLKDFPFYEQVKDYQDNVPVRYLFNGKYKYMLLRKNQKYNFITFASIENEEITEDAIVSVYAMAAISVIGLLFIAFLIYIILKKRLHPLEESKDVLESMAEGNLTKTLKVLSMDEIGEMAISINSFNKKVKTILGKIVEASSNLASSSDEMSGALNFISDNAQNQAASSEEISASIEEISAGMDGVETQTREQVGLLDRLALDMEKFSDSIHETSANLEKTMSEVEKITEDAKQGGSSLELTNHSINKISKSSEDITGVMEIINTISEQIHLLALNAAIEAARAGAAGKGFAVVADEISKLADKTTRSIKDIEEIIQSNETEIGHGIQNITNTVTIISGIISGISEINRRMKTVNQFMEDQLSKNDQMNLTAKEVKGRSDVIQVAVREQKLAIEEISRTITTINELNQSSAASSEELSSSSVGLAGLAEELKREVEFFKL